MCPNKMCLNKLSSERINGQRRKELRAPKVGGFAAHLIACRFFEFWRGGARSRIVFLEVFARWPLFLSDDTNKISQNGRPGGREPPRSTSFDETSRIKSV